MTLHIKKSPENITKEITATGGHKPESLRILVVDDAQINRYVLIKFLNKILKNIEIDESHDGLDTLKKLSDKYYDLIFLDIKMPKLSGDKVAEIIKKDNSTTIIIGVTGQIEILEQVLKTGMNYCLIKPIDFKYLRSFLHSIVSDIHFIN